MTGYGKATAELPEKKINVEIKSRQKPHRHCNSGPHYIRYDQNISGNPRNGQKPGKRGLQGLYSFY